jgi:virulence factor lipase-like protein
MPYRCDRMLVALALVLLVPSLALAAGVTALFDLSSPSTGPFPSDRFTIADATQNTGVRVDLPKPSCGVRPSDCADIDVLNTLDGFNLQPRLSIPFTGAIDPASVSSANVFLVSLGDTLGGGGDGKPIGINQVVWDPATNTLYAESDELLDQHTRYALIVTRGVRDMAGDPVEAGAFATFRHDLNFGQSKDPALKAYRKSLLDALAVSGVNPTNVVAASVFSTQSATADLEKIRDQIKAATPAPATMLGVFPRSDVLAVQFKRQVETAPTFVTSTLPAVVDIVPGAVGTIAFGKYTSPDYETAEKFIPAVGTRTGVPAVQATNDIYFDLFLPSGTPPSGGWPVAIFGHGFTDSKQGAPIVVASVLASHGVATIAINVVGHGGGPLGTLTILRASGPPVTIPAGGRGIDQDGNGTIDSTEGVNATPPQTIISSRDGLRQTVVDIMQLVRLIETGGVPGLSSTRIYYAGQSFGGIYGTILLGVEPSIRAGVPNVPGGAIIEIARLSPSFRFLVGLSLGFRVPSLANLPPAFDPAAGAVVPQFDENMPLRDQPPLVNTVPGAAAIQEFIEHSEWVSQSGNPVAYAPHIRKSPLGDLDAKPVIIQFAKGDKTVPNPTASALIRAGDLADRATYFRNDLAFAANSATPKNPHTFLTNVGVPAVAAFAVGAQQQIGFFFETDGAVTIDPDGTGPFFEVPIAGPLPETLSFIP